jgi:hypothetical protein
MPFTLQKSVATSSSIYLKRKLEGEVYWLHFRFLSRYDVTLSSLNTYINWLYTGLVTTKTGGTSATGDADADMKEHRKLADLCRLGHYLPDDVFQGAVTDAMIEKLKGGSSATTSQRLPDTETVRYFYGSPVPNCVVIKVLVEAYARHASDEALAALCGTRPTYLPYSGPVPQAFREDLAKKQLEFKVSRTTGIGAVGNCKFHLHPEQAGQECKVAAESRKRRRLE